MRKHLFFCILVSWSYFTSAQLQIPAPVQITDFEIESPGMSAIYLVNDAYTSIRSRKGGTVNSTAYIYRIKILKKDALDLGSIRIPLVVNDEKKPARILNINATTYNLNPDTGKIERSQVYQEEIFSNHINEDLSEVAFTMPNVKVNSIIELYFKKESLSVFRLDNWYFQKEYPVLKSRYEIGVFAPLIYRFYLHGLRGLRNIISNRSDSTMTQGKLPIAERQWWQIENLPAYRDEPFTSTREDHVSKLSIQLESTPTKTFLKSWEDVTQDLQGSKRFEQFYAGNKDFLPEDMPEGIPSYAKAKFIFEDFKKNFIWDGNYGVYPNVSFRELIGKKEGNTSSLGLALFQILKQAGYQVEPVLLSPRQNGKINYNYPFIDNLIATVVRLTLDGKVYLLDPVHDVPFGFLHQSFLNEKGLVLSDTVEWQELTLGLKDYKTSQVSITVADDQISADIELNMKDFGVVSGGVDPVDLFKSDWEVSAINLDRNEATVQRLTAKIEREVEDDLILVPLSFDEIIFTENPFKEEKRLYSIDFLYSKQYSYKLDINLSDAYEFESLPESRIVKTADGKLSALMNVNQLGQKLNVTFLFWTKTNDFDVAYYAALQQAYELMEELANGLIIVKRKS